jgi:hypothetical protein
VPGDSVISDKIITFAAPQAPYCHLQGFIRISGRSRHFARIWSLADNFSVARHSGTIAKASGMAKCPVNRLSIQVEAVAIGLRVRAHSAAAALSLSTQ